MESKEHGGEDTREQSGFINERFRQWLESLPLQSDDGIWFQDYIRGLGRGADPGKKQEPNQS